MKRSIPSAPGDDRPIPRAVAAVAALLLLLAFILRLAPLGRDGLWVDEAFTAGLCHLPWGQMWAALGADDAPAFFYLAERLVVGLGGESEAMLRLFPALCGCATVLAAAALARRHASAAIIPITAAVGFSALLTFYSRQARAYAVVHLLSVLLVWIVLELRRHPTARRFGIFTALCWIALYSHNLGLLLVAAGAASILPLLARPELRRRIAVAAGVFLIGAIPWALRLLEQVPVHRAGNLWMGAWWKQGRLLELGPGYSWAVFANAAAPAVHPPIPLPGGEGALAPLAWIGWAVAAAGLWGGVRALRRGEARTLGLVLGLFALLPLVGLVLISRLVGPAYVLGRTDTLALPAFLILIGLGWQGWGRRFALIPVLLWILLGLASDLPLWSGQARINKRADRALAEELGARVRPGDALVHASLSRPSLDYYARRQHWADRLAWTGSYPSMLDRNAAAVAPMPLDSAGGWQQEALRLRAEWTRAGIERVFVLAVRDDRSAPPTGAAGSASWPSTVAVPPAERAQTDAARIGYPTNVLVSTLAGLGPVPVELEYHQDWVSGERVVLRLERRSWVPIDSIPRVEAAR